jgi:hypothetical protein
MEGGMVRMVSIGIFFFVLFSILVSVETMAVREIPDDNLVCPVKITLGNCANSSGGEASGFFLNTKTATYLVTARHVLFAEQEHESKTIYLLFYKQVSLSSYFSIPNEKEKKSSSSIYGDVEYKWKCKNSYDHDVAVIRRGEFSQVGEKRGVSSVLGVQAIESAYSGILGTSLDTIKKIDEVLTANEVYVFGYPTSIGVRDNPQIDYQKPLIRRGIIAGINDQKKTIILDCLVFAGNSGGPVL